MQSGVVPTQLTLLPLRDYTPQHDIIQGIELHMKRFEYLEAKTLPGDLGQKMNSKILNLRGL